MKIEYDIKWTYVIIIWTRLNKYLYFFLMSFNVIICTVNSQKIYMECSVSAYFSQSTSQDLVKEIMPQETHCRMTAQTK